MSERTQPTEEDRAPGAPSRRTLLACSGAGLGSWLLRGRLGAQTAAGFPIPADKGLDPAWLRALVERGEATVARGGELALIGMPIGGIGCGQLHLGGDGRLWHWDLFDEPPSGPDPRSGPHYAKPLEPAAFLLDFTVHLTRRSGGAALPLAASAFDEVEFRGTYPIGTVTYRSRRHGLEIELQAFSPFVPTELEDSSLPATLLHFRIRNTGTERLAVTLRGRLQSPVLRTGDPWTDGFERTTRSVRSEDLAMVVHGAEVAGGEGREDLPFDGFTGEPAADAPPGTRTSREFVIERAWIHFPPADGAAQGGTGLEVLVDDQVVAEVTGLSASDSRSRALFVGDLEGMTARMRLVDPDSGGPGGIGVDSILFSDRSGGDPLEGRADYGSIALGLLGPGWDTELSLPEAGKPGTDEVDPSMPVRAGAGWSRELEPDAEGAADFVLAWHFPNAERSRLASLPGSEPRRRHYAARFADAAAVASFVAAEHARLAAATRAWRDTWYDSSLPHWLLERTLANASTLATATCLRLEDGRFLGRDGVGCGAGTATHVWHYAQSPARLFPALERDQRERVDLGVAFHPDSGQVDARAEAGRELAVDGQAGVVLRVWREHTQAPDDSFLRRVWPRAKKALEFLLARDPDGDGLLDGAQPSTLGATWYGAVPWLSSLYLAAVRAGESMAEELGDATFAARCRALCEAGAKAFVTRLYQGESFVQRLDPAHPEANAAGNGCAIDQVLGQAWAHQVGLGRILPERETRAALRALWKYNFAPDVGPYRRYMSDRLPGGRWLAMAGEAGLLMATWPAGGHEVAAGTGPEAGLAGIANECLTGFEHQVAAHMLWEGWIEEGLAVERAVHDRYHPSKRNPYDEIECGDHSARAMASHGVFLAVCGFELHGPKGHLGFDPRLTPERFRAAFTAPEGWGSWSQTIDGTKRLEARLELRHGRLRLVTLRIGHAGKAAVGQVTARLGATELACTHESDGTRVLVRFESPLALTAGDALVIACAPG